MSSRVPVARFGLRAGHGPGATTSPCPFGLSSAPAIHHLSRHPVSPRCVFSAGALRSLGPALVPGDRSSALEWLPPTVPQDPQLLWDPSLAPWALLPRGPRFQLHLQFLAHLLCCDRFQSQQDFSQKIQPRSDPILSLSGECILETKETGAREKAPSCHLSCPKRKAHSSASQLSPFSRTVSPWLPAKLKDSAF